MFYVGKGHGKRANDMRRGRNRWHKAIQAKLADIGMCVEVRMVADCLTESEALAFEVDRIAMWRRLGVRLSNITDGGDGTTGRKHTDEWKRAMSERMTGRKKSPEHVEKVRQFHIGKQWGLGYKKTPEQIERSAAGNRGKKRSPETKALLREIRLANPTSKPRGDTERPAKIPHLGRKASEETKAKMRKPKSEEHKQKLREANLGKTHTEETRKMLSDMAKADHARRRAAKALTEN